MRAHIVSADMDSLRERFADALAQQRATPAALAKEIGVTRQTLYNIADGTTKAESIRAVTLLPLADALGVSPDWLLYGRGPRALNRQTENNSRSEPIAPSQSQRLDHSIITQAKRWVMAEEVLAGPYPRDELVDQVLAVYELMLDSGGVLSTEQRAARFSAAQGRAEGDGERDNKADAG